MDATEVLLVTPLMRSAMDELDRSYRVHRLYEADDRDRFVADIGTNVRGIATDGHAGASAALMEALPKLEIVSCYGVGVDAVDLSYAASRNVKVTNTPGVLNDDVANLGVGLLLAASRGIVSGDRFVRDRRWLKGNMSLRHSVRDKPVGILGLGRIGKDIARKLGVFGCEIVYHGRHEQPDEPYRYYADLVGMARECDYLIVICPGSDETRNMVNREVMDALGPDGTLINVARGSVVDEPALVSALRDGRLGGAALDVFADEPRVPEALLTMDNVIVQPHQASATVETRQAMGDLMIRNLALHFSGQAVATPVVPG